VRPTSGGDEKAALAQRVSEQIVENDQRAAISEAQRARGIQ
jgi:ParB family transcriptional regulator, chromosome partitioning protein